MAIEPEHGLSEEIIYKGKLFTVKKEMVRLPNGHERPREIVIHPGAVALVVVDDQDRLLMVRQYRRAADRALLEIPAGTREPGEDAESCARREIQEEVGYAAGKVTPLGGFFSAPGFCTEYLDLFLMTDLSESQGLADEDENIEVEKLTADEALEAIRRGDICDAKSICGVLLWLQEKAKLVTA